MEVQLRPAPGHRGAEPVHRWHLLPASLIRVTQNPLGCVRQRESVHRVQAGHQAGLHREGDLYPGPQPPQHAGASCHVMSCHVMSCHVMSCHLQVHLCGNTSAGVCSNMTPFNGKLYKVRRRIIHCKLRRQMAAPFILFNFIYSAS